MCQHVQKMLASDPEEVIQLKKPQDVPRTGFAVEVPKRVFFLYMYIPSFSFHIFFSSEEGCEGGSYVKIIPV